MAAEDNNSISIDDLFAAFGAGSPSSNSSKSEKKQNKKEENSNEVSEIDLLAAFGLATPKETQQINDRNERKTREQLREAQLKEQQIRAQQWKRELQQRNAGVQEEDDAPSDVVSTIAPDASRTQKSSISRVFSNEGVGTIKPFTVAEPSFLNKGAEHNAEQHQSLTGSAPQPSQMQANGQMPQNAQMPAVSQAQLIQPLQQPQGTFPVQPFNAGQIQPLTQATNNPEAKDQVGNLGQAGQSKIQPLGTPAEQTQSPIQPLSPFVGVQTGASQVVESAPKWMGQQPGSVAQNMPLSQNIQQPQVQFPQPQPQPQPQPPVEAAFPTEAQGQTTIQAQAAQTQAIQQPKILVVEPIDESTVQAEPVVEEVSAEGVKFRKIQPVQKEPDVDAETKKETKKSNIIGIILIAIALVCAVFAILLLLGLVDFSSNRPARGQANTAAVTENVQQNTADTQDKSSQAVYSYVIRGSEGTTHEAIETATFGNDGMLSASTLEINVNGQEESDAMLEELKNQFGESIKESSAEPDKVTVVMDVARDDLDKDAYTELLSANMADFKVIS